MAKITVSEPNGPYCCMLDTDVMNVNIQEVYKGIEFVTREKEQVTVFMRDTGYELTYRSPDKDNPVIVELKNGDVHINGKRVYMQPE